MRSMLAEKVQLPDLLGPGKQPETTRSKPGQAKPPRTASVEWSCLCSPEDFASHPMFIPWKESYKVLQNRKELGSHQGDPAHDEVKATPPLINVGISHAPGN